MRIKLINIVKSFSGKKVIDGVSLTMESGEFTTLLGPSGCGKTTLLRMIVGLETPDAGEIYFDEQCVFSAVSGVNLPPEKRGLGFVFQDFALWPHMTVFENVAFGLKARGETKELQEKVRAALESVRLEGFESRYPHQLSGGQQQRVAFARAIAVNPPCILFDEPLSALDAILREEMRTELKALVARLGTTSVFVTHDQIEAMSMSDRIAVLNQGEVEQYGSPEEIYERPSTPFVARFVGKSNWISENAMIRPEHLSLTPGADGDMKIMVVDAVQYLGSAYEVSLKSEDLTWSMVTGRRIEPGQRLTVFVDSGHVTRFPAESCA